MKIIVFYSIGSTAIGIVLGLMGFRIEVVIVASMLAAPVFHVLWLIARVKGIVP